LGALHRRAVLLSHGSSVSRRSIIDLPPDNDALVGSFDQLGNRFVPLIEGLE
jgi:hypothetical protein